MPLIPRKPLQMDDIEGSPPFATGSRPGRRASIKTRSRSYDESRLCCCATSTVDNKAKDPSSESCATNTARRRLFSRGPFRGNFGGDMSQKKSRTLRAAFRKLQLRQAYLVAGTCNHLKLLFQAVA